MSSRRQMKYCYYDDDDDDGYDDDGRGVLRLSSKVQSMACYFARSMKKALSNKGCVIAAIANFSISYNVLDISLALQLMKEATDDMKERDSVVAQESVTTSALILGMVAGQLVFGVMADCLGRFKGLTFALLLCSVGAFGSAVLTFHTRGGFNLMLQLCVWRLFLGVGAGGVYPLAATIARESQSQGDDEGAAELNVEVGVEIEMVSRNATLHDMKQCVNEIDGVGPRSDVKGGNNQTDSLTDSHFANGHRHHQSQVSGGTSHNEEEGNGRSLYHTHSHADFYARSHNHGDVLGGGGGGGSNSASAAVAFIFGVQGLGYLAVPLTYWILLYCNLKGLLSLEGVWRLALGIGGLPCLLLAGVSWWSRPLQERRDGGGGGGGGVDGGGGGGHRRGGDGSRATLFAPSCSTTAANTEAGGKLMNDGGERELTLYTMRAGGRGGGNASTVTSAVEYDDDDVMSKTTNKKRRGGGGGGGGNGGYKNGYMSQYIVGSSLIHKDDDEGNEGMCKDCNSSSGHRPIGASADSNGRSYSSPSLTRSRRSPPPPLAKSRNAPRIVEEEAEGGPSMAAQDDDNEREAESPLRVLWQALQSKEYAPLLAGTAGAWFLFDVTFYGNTLFQPTVLEEVFTNMKDDPIALARTNALVALIALPGYFVSVALMQKMGPRVIQLRGFTLMALLYVTIAVLMQLGVFHANTALLLLLYSLTFFFSNFGPNSTTFVLPSLVFPQEVRGSLNGLSAAAGKLGALVGSMAFGPLAERWGIPPVLFICGVMAVVGAVVTALFIPTSSAGFVKIQCHDEDNDVEVDAVEELGGSQ